MRYGARITRDYWHEANVEVEADNHEEAKRKIMKNISNTVMKIGGAIEGTDEVHELRELRGVDGTLDHDCVEIGPGY